MTLIRVLVAAICVATISPVWADWRVDEQTDSMTDEVRHTASTVNSSGYRLTFYRMPDGSVWGNFKLPAASSELLSNKAWPMYRVDRNPPRNLDDERRLSRLVRGVPAYAENEPKWINFRVWDGNAEQGRHDGLIEIINGSRLVFRYTLFTGGYSETTFDLTGARAAITTIARIEQALPRMERAESVRRLMAAAHKRCSENAVREDFAVCAARLEPCKDAESVEAVSACLEDRK